MKRHRTIVGPSLPTRSLAPALGRASLPTVAAVAALLSFASSAQAITSTKDTGVEEPEGDAAIDDAGGADASYCPPATEIHPIAGGMPPPRIHGTGCGCGGQGNDDTGVAVLAAASLVALLRTMRRR